MKLLLVEDDPMVGSLLQDGSWNHAGYNVELCEDGRMGETALYQDAAAIGLDLGTSRPVGPRFSQIHEAGEVGSAGANPFG